MLDVTCGSGAFMKNKDQAIQLANTMKKIGELVQKETVCVVTNMDEPLGKAIGNSLEVIEGVKALQGEMEKDVKEVVFTLGAYMLKLAGKGENIEENKRKIEEQIKNKKAFEKCKEWIQTQGGDSSYLEDLEKWKKAKYILPVVAQKSGYVVSLDAQKVGEISMRLGAGRVKKEDTIDPAVGVMLEKKIGDKVEKGQILSYIYANNEKIGKEEQLKLQQVYEIGEEKVEKSHILAII